VDGRNKCGHDVEGDSRLSRSVVMAGLKREARLHARARPSTSPLLFNGLSNNRQN
jgi:hypothetical protein